MNFLQDIDIEERQELTDLKEIREVFYAVKDPGPYSSDENIIKAVDEWINSKETTRKKVFQLLGNKMDDPSYACILGLFHHYGIGVQIDRSMAFTCYRFAAESKSDNNAFAQNQLGYCYRDGLGTINNSEKAFECFKKSAEGGHMCGMRTLADHYYNGWNWGYGTRRDLHEALYWAKKDQDGSTLWLLPTD
ncbi:5086_t:CDS:2 [Ambispora gerdemannii]|uniref:5086_t:CDS:1 n=1 Tax=Ambispora gerdemannii TaxID=144530 RepID=A0A9N9AED9_9GLOM|nr:5086_t:CDS:2 [Ambispora gerdemannii]